MKFEKLLLMSLIALTGSQAFAESYTLVCRGGDLRRAVYRGETDRIDMDFRRGTRAASLGVDPGHCAWIDRGLTNAEPATVCHANVDAKTVSWSNQGARLVVKAVNAPYFDFIYDSSRVFTFQAYNDTRGCLVVTRLGP